MCAESTVTVVAISHEMQPKPVFVADDRRRDVSARQPKKEDRMKMLNEIKYGSIQRHIYNTLAFT